MSGSSGTGPLSEDAFLKRGSSNDPLDTGWAPLKRDSSQRGTGAHVVWSAEYWHVYCATRTVRGSPEVQWPTFSVKFTRP